MIEKYHVENVYKFELESFLLVNLIKKWERQTIALSKPFNFYLKHFLIFWTINEIFKKNAAENPGTEEKFLAKNSILY